MKQSTDTQKDKKTYLKWVLLFFAAMLAIYLYFVLADLSTAPAYVYGQF